MREPTIPLGAEHRDDIMKALTEALEAERADRAAAITGSAPFVNADTFAAEPSSTAPRTNHPEARWPAVTRLDEELAGLESFHVPAAVNHLRDLAYASAVAAGWHDPKVIEGVHREPSAGERVALIHEEATELLGHIRDGYVAGHWTDREGDALPSGPGKPEGPDVELADIVIRCLDYAGRYEIDLGAVIAEKMRYNRERAHRHGRRTL